MITYHMAKAVLICSCKVTTLGKTTAVRSVTRVSLQQSIVIFQDLPDFCRSHSGELNGQKMGITIPILFGYFIATTVPTEYNVLFEILSGCVDVTVSEPHPLQQLKPTGHGNSVGVVSTTKYLHSNHTSRKWCGDHGMGGGIIWWTHSALLQTRSLYIVNSHMPSFKQKGHIDPLGI